MSVWIKEGILIWCIEEGMSTHCFAFPKVIWLINFKVIKEEKKLTHIVFGSLDIPFFVCIPFVQLLLLCLMCIKNPFFVIFEFRPQGMQYC